MAHEKETKSFSFPFSFFSRVLPLPQAHKCRPYEHTAESSFQQAKNQVLTRHGICQPLDLEPPACRTVRGKCLLFKSVVFCYSSLSWIRQAEWQFVTHLVFIQQIGRLPQMEVKGSFKEYVAALGLKPGQKHISPGFKTGLSFSDHQGSNLVRLC